MLQTLGLVYLVSFAVMPLILMTDRRWYALHPGAEEMFARIDVELEWGKEQLPRTGRRFLVLPSGPTLS